MLLTGFLTAAALACMCLVTIIMALFWSGFNTIGAYGKNRTETSSLEVPRKWGFSHPYMFAALLNGMLLRHMLVSRGDGLQIINTKLIEFFPTLAQALPASGSTSWLSSLTLGFLVQMQVMRRLYESLYVLESNGNMHVLAYCFSYLHYFLLVACTLADSEALHPTYTHDPNMVSGFKDKACLLIGCCLFSFGVVHQTRAHRILSAIRRPASLDYNGPPKYSIPEGDWFQLVSMPHYTAELIIYFAFVVVAQGQSMCLWAMFVWTLTNLCITGSRTHSWYLTKFKESYPRERKAVIPFLF